MDVLGAYHPAIVHLPIALIVTSLLFDVIGRATDLAWWRRAATAMLVIGVLGASLAVVSGRIAEDPVHDRQAVPRAVIESHENAGYLALAAGLGALVARVVAVWSGRLRVAAGAVAFLLHLAAAVLVSITGYRGGELVFEYGAGVKVHGKLIESGPPGEPDPEELARTGEHAPAVQDPR